MVRAAGFAVIQGAAPAGLVPKPGDKPLESMSGILETHGFRDAEQLSTYLSAWRDLFCLTRSDFVFASYAPISLLAARAVNLPTALGGNAFEIPPPCEVSPSFRPWLNTPTAELSKRDLSVMSTVKRVMKDSNLRLETISDIFESPLQWMWTFPELDPYGAIRQCGRAGPIYCGPVVASSDGEAPVFPSVFDQCVFGYLRMSLPRLELLARRLEQVEASFLIVVPGADATSIASLGRRNVRIVSSRVNLSLALKRCHAVLNYASHGTVCESLLAGRPLVLVPEQMEGVTIAGSVSSLGAALCPPASDPSAIAAACNRVLHEPGFAQAAMDFRNRHSGHDPAQRVETIAEAISTAIITRLSTKPSKSF